MLRIISTVIGSVILLCLSLTANAELEAVDIYSQKQLSQLVRNNLYLQRVKADDCQLVQDIEARAEVLKEPLYQFLWGEMLNTGTCVNTDLKRGMTLVTDSAKQGLAEAMYRLARYHDQGELVIQNKDKAIKYALPAAYSGYIPAQMLLVKLFIEDIGSPVDYETGYRLLHNNTYDSQDTKHQAEHLLQQLAKKMPVSAVKRAERGY
ncbi:MAG: sel1 repeat family protein [Shewanella sp.]|nr:sel1 repeat family protein [Shewanella sp.]